LQKIHVMKIHRIKISRFFFIINILIQNFI